MYTLGQKKKCYYLGKVEKMTDTKSLLKKYGITPNKALGQNFLVNFPVAEKIVEASDTEGKNVLEIGPGLGALTGLLTQRAKKVVAVEIDEKMANVIKNELPQVEVIHEDFLDTNIDNLFGGEQFSVAANLPYYVTTPICIKLLCNAHRIDSMTLMLQKEAGQRFFEKEGSKKYGPLTVLANRSCTVKKIAELSPSDYYPMPDVDSVVVHLECNKNITDNSKMEKLLNCAFSMRRKTLVNNLMAMNFTREEAEKILEKANLQKTVRAEAVDISGFERLLKAMNEE